ncbi:hypothetical protein KR018_009044, partial [Drosophila ironensis]
RGSTMSVLDLGDAFAPIILDYPDARIFTKCSSYGNRVLGMNWNKFIVYHNGSLEYREDKQELILEAIYAAVGVVDFFPVNYQRGRMKDTFLARDCKQTIDHLFSLNLSITLETNQTLGIGVQMGVAKYNRNQITPSFLIAAKLTKLMKKLVQRNNVGDLLDLDNFGAHPEFRHIVVSLANPTILMYVCQVIRNDPDVYRMRGLILSNNRIKELPKLNLLSNCNLDVLDLSGNRIRSAERFCRDMVDIHVKNLVLTNNPIANSSKFPKNIKAIANNFTLVNGFTFDNVMGDYCLVDDIDLDSDGIRIDQYRVGVFDDFRSSGDWHAFFVIDEQHSLTRDTLFDFWFVVVNPDLSEIYPCYYKFVRNMHVFLVRKCLDQIEHMAQVGNMQVIVPPIGDRGEQFFPYYLRMNVSTFNAHHVNPHICIQKAVDQSFVPHSRLLNLAQFQSNKNLQNVVVHLSSLRILSSVLLLASKKFMDRCSEIRLCDNKIFNIGTVNFLTRIGSLRAIDLSHNWIHDLDNIKSLGVLPLKSLVLHGNPVCRNYKMPSEYVAAIKHIFPLLTTLDGVEIPAKPGQTTQKNFLCDIGAYELVGDVFLKNYLREFEGDNTRQSLLKYYTNDSIFTMTCSYKLVHNSLPAATAQTLRRMSQYNSVARNLHKLDNSKASNFVYVGGMEILEVLLKLPKVRHDFHSLQTDVMHYNGKSAVIYVTGLLRDESPGIWRDQNFYLAFSRQFVIKFEEYGLVRKCPPNKTLFTLLFQLQGLGKMARRLKITNERFNVMNPSSNMIKNAFKVERPMKKEPSADENSVDVKDHKLRLFQEVTGLINTWCTMIVEEAGWDFEKALRLFVKKAKDKQIPDQAFA